MKRSTIVSIEFSQKHIKMCILEDLQGNIIEIMNEQALIQDAPYFLEKKIAYMRANIQKDLQYVDVIIDPSEKTKAQIKVIREKISLSASTVTEQHLKTLIKQVELKYSSDDSQVIFAHPLQYKLLGTQSKTYFNLPLGKKGEQLEIMFALTNVTPVLVDFIKKTLQKQKLKINKIILKPQALVQNNLSGNALQQGAINLHISKSYTYLMINKYSASVAGKIFFNYGYQHLVKGIAFLLKCDQHYAQKLLSIYGSTKVENPHRVIDVVTYGSKQVAITANDLRKIILKFIHKALSLSYKYLHEKEALNLPLVISGELNFINDFEQIAQKYLPNAVTKYTPMTYVEINKQNRATNGLNYLHASYAKSIGESILSIIETNPEKFFKNNNKQQTKKRNIWSKWLQKIGGYYERN